LLQPDIAAPFDKNSNLLGTFFGSPIGYSFRYYVEGITQNTNVKKLIDWILSPEGQRIIDNNGYIPLKTA